MRFKDYLIIPVVAMYVLYTSCAYIAPPADTEVNKAAESIVPAYECSYGSCAFCADKDAMIGQILSGEFVNSQNPDDRYVFKESGKSAEYIGDRVFRGKWTLEDDGTLKVFDFDCGEYFNFELVFGRFGEVAGFEFNNIFFALA